MKENIWKTTLLVLSLALLTLAFFSHSNPQLEDQEASTKEQKRQQDLQVATFAGGCFWCIESRFEKIEGVSRVISGYSGGSIKNPTYKQVSAGQTNHVEAVQLHYDPTIVSYKHLLHAFWREIDPTDNGGQFVDRGQQYRPYVFYHSPQQQLAAEESRTALEYSGRFSKKINTEIMPFTVFYAAEEYHQDYYSRNPIRYKYYRYHSGRDQFLDKIWSVEMDSINMKQKTSAMNLSSQKYHKPADELIREKLTPLQYKVTQHEGTERPFDNTYWDEKREGIYVDVVSGEPLFSSTDKYDSKSGWPSFSQAIKGVKITEKTDSSLFSSRTEVRSHIADSHLGHVFNDGPQPTGLRYCINSAAMRFIPKAEMENAGYGEYLVLFK